MFDERIVLFVVLLFGRFLLDSHDPSQDRESKIVTIADNTTTFAIGEDSTEATNKLQKTSNNISILTNKCRTELNKSK